MYNLRIYLAGPYSADSIVKAMANIRQGQYATNVLLNADYDVHCPWLDYQLLLSGEITVDAFQRNSMSFLRHWANLMIMLPGWFNSKGTRAELEEAFKLGIPCYDYNSDFVVEELGLGMGWWEP